MAAPGGGSRNAPQAARRSKQDTFSPHWSGQTWQQKRGSRKPLRQPAPHAILAASPSQWLASPVWDGNHLPLLLEDSALLGSQWLASPVWDGNPYCSAEVWLMVNQSQWLASPVWDGNSVFPSKASNNRTNVSMAGLSRLGWKLAVAVGDGFGFGGLNDWPLPSGMETVVAGDSRNGELQSQWPASPVWDGNREKSSRLA